MTRNGCLFLMALPVTLLLPTSASLFAQPTSSKPGLVYFQDSDQAPSALTLHIDTGLRKKLDAIDDYARQGEWAEVTHILQSLLDATEDAFVPVTNRNPEGKAATRWVSVRTEANRILGSLPLEGRKFYDERFADRARSRLEAALKQGDMEKLAGVAVNYFHTRAGRDASRLLAASLLERGDFVMAAICYDRLLALPDVPDAHTLWLACLARRLSGDKAGADAAWKLLATKYPDGLTIGDRTISLETLQKELSNQEAASQSARADRAWPVHGGDAARSAVPTGSDPKLESCWQRQACVEALSTSWLQTALTQMEAKSQPAIPAAAPIAISGKLIWRSQHGVEVVDAHSGKLLWATAESLRWGLDYLAADTAAQLDVNPWLTNHLQSNPSVLLENSVLGNLSTDGKLVYAVEDLPFPPVVSTQPNRSAPLAPAPAFLCQPLTNAVYHSRLVAFNLDDGRMLWDLGGRSTPGKDGINSPVHDAYFLGPPLPLGGKLYSLIEKAEDMRLLCLDPAKGEILWSQLLGSARTHMVQDGGRRLFAAPIAYGQGILLCPTNCGTIVAVDLLSHSLLWAHSYPAELFVKASQLGPRRAITSIRFDSFWKGAAPIIKGNSAIIAQADGTAVECLNLHDGSLRWQAPRLDDDLYVAVSDDRVLIVGKKQCRALGLTDGKEAWTLDPVANRVDAGPFKSEMVTGIGQLVGNLYYLPQTMSVKVIDLKKGEVVKRIPVAKNDSLGNLVWAEGMVFAQTALGLFAYPQDEVSKDGGK